MLRPSAWIDGGAGIARIATEYFFLFGAIFAAIATGIGSAKAVGANTFYLGIKAIIGSIRIIAEWPGILFAAIGLALPVIIFTAFDAANFRIGIAIHRISI